LRIHLQRPEQFSKTFDGRGRERFRKFQSHGVEELLSIELRHCLLLRLHRRHLRMTFQYQLPSPTIRSADCVTPRGTSASLASSMTPLTSSRSARSKWRPFFARLGAYATNL